MNRHGCAGLGNSITRFLCHIKVVLSSTLDSLIHRNLVQVFQLNGASSNVLLEYVDDVVNAKVRQPCCVVYRRIWWQLGKVRIVFANCKIASVSPLSCLVEIIHYLIVFFLAAHHFFHVI